MSSRVVLHKKVLNKEELTAEEIKNLLWYSEIKRFYSDAVDNLYIISILDIDSQTYLLRWGEDLTDMFVNQPVKISTIIEKEINMKIITTYISKDSDEILYKDINYSEKGVIKFV